MTRIPGNRPLPIQPQNDTLTALLGAAIVIQIIVIVVMIVRSYAIFDGGMFVK